MAEDYSDFKRIGGAIGVILLIIGILCIIYSFTFWGSGSKDMGDEGWFEEQSERGNLWFAYGAGGMFLAFIGYVLLYFTMLRRVSKYVATETAPAVGIMGEAAGKGMATGISEAGGIKLTHEHHYDHNHETSQKEIIKIKCRNCGYLDTEDAEFCSKCGEKI